MRFRTWPVAALGLGGLLLLVVVSVLAASNRAQQIYTRLDELNTHHREVENMLRLLRSDLSLSGIYIRDYLLDPERARSSDYRYQLAQYRQSNVTTVAKLRELMAPHTGHDERLVSLDAKLDEYWQAFEPLFDWTPTEKMLLSSGFLKHEVLPRREAVLTIALQIEALNNSNHSIQRAEIARQYAEFRSELQKLLWGSLLLGFIVAMTAVIRLRILERRSEEERAVTEEAERQMRQLSQQLVATQEEERKKLSRELHDHVGQMLTALRMELGRIDRLRSAADRVRQVPGESGSAVLARERDAGAEASVAGAVAECRQLVDNMVRSVRDLALGLRPSMLDDFGLQPALEWHVRDFSRRFGVPVELKMEGDFDRLTDQHRTCVYRAVQEALTNCVKHARARQIEVNVTDESDGLSVSISDDGIGLDPALKAKGLGLRGIEERVRELRGAMAIHSAPDAGTTLKIRVPLPPRPTEVLRARAAG